MINLSGDSSFSENKIICKINLDKSVNTDPDSYSKKVDVNDECTITESSIEIDNENQEEIKELEGKKKIFSVHREKRENSKNMTSSHSLNLSEQFKFKERTLHRKNKSQASKNFKCHFTQCDKSYRSKENLTLHIKNIHMGIKPYKCRMCESVFSHRNGKSYHEKSFHFNLHPYYCTFPGNLFF